MERFTPSTVTNLAYLLLTLTVIWYFVVAIRARASGAAKSLAAFLRYEGRTVEPRGLTAEVLHASLMGSAFSLASSIYVYLNWAASDGMFVLWSPITWALGAFVLVWFRRRIFQESRGSWTMHGFLGLSFQSQGVLRAASLVTSVVFLLQVVAEVYVGIAVLELFAGSGISRALIATLIAAIFVGYSAIGGLPGILVTDWVKYKLTSFALLVAFLALLDQGGASAIERVTQSFAATFLPSTRGSWIVLVSLVCLNLPLLVTDMSVWQRVGAADDEHEASRGLASFASLLLPWLGLIVCVGVGFGGFLVPAEGQTTAQAILAFFGDSLVFPFLLAGLFAALLTTADSFLIAAVQTLLVDWRFQEQLTSVRYQDEDLPQVVQAKMVRTAEWAIVTLGLGAVALGYYFLARLPALLDLLFVVFGMQTALAPSVLSALLGRARPIDAKASLMSILGGGATALVCLALALGGVEMGGVTVGLWAPIAVVVVAGTTYILVPRRAQGPSGKAASLPIHIL